MCRHLLQVDSSVVEALDKPPAGGPLQRCLLVVGTDIRRGLAGHAGQLTADVTGARADAIVLVAVNEVGREVMAVTLPRDLEVDLAGIGRERLGASLEYGGASMVVRAVRSLLSVPLHHFVSMDFQAFACVIDSVGGVEIEVEGRRVDHRTGLRIERGPQRLTGSQALAYVRSRHQDPEGLDSHPCPPLGGSLGQPEDGSASISARLDDGSRRRALRDVLAAIRPSTGRMRSAWTAVKIAGAARGHLVVDAALLEPRILSTLTRAASWPTTFADLPSRPTRPAPLLCSPFPPFQRHSARYLMTDEAAAAAIAERLRQHLR
jgi:LCP family protein required for cell wall assembly